MIHEIIEKNDFFHCYQHLYKLKCMSAIGAELLLRTEMGNPEFIFQLAREENKLFELDTKSIDRAFQTFFSQQEIVGLLFSNIFPSTILHPNFPSFVAYLLEHYPNLSKNVVFEIIETEKVDDEEKLKEKVQFLKKWGFQIAVDDVGKGWSSLCLIIELEPDFIKLDRYFSIDLANSAKKQKMIKLLLHFFEDTDTKMILEGIETSSDLRMAQSLGIHFCQGYLLSKPMPLIVV
ncbi:MAG TPA: EAL domain-containing protein [Bacillales bacterium]|nr:EAL domain-containing protein [Bacillales bacterium]